MDGAMEPTPSPSEPSELEHTVQADRERAIENAAWRVAQDLQVRKFASLVFLHVSIFPVRSLYTCIHIVPKGRSSL
jgi:hypothetical protein